MSIRATAGEAFDITLATAPSVPGGTAFLTALYGPDGEQAGLAGDGSDLELPLALSEGADGVYWASVLLAESGPYWARFELNGAEAGVAIVRCSPPGWAAADAQTGTEYEFAAIAPTRPASLELAARYPDGSDAGADLDGEGISWPVSMVQVPGHTDCWHHPGVVFSEGGRIHVTLSPPTGPSMNSVITVDEPVQATAYAHFDGFEAEGPFLPADWVSLSYVRKWCGWPQGNISDEDLRELRRTAIETFVHETNCFAAGWSGTWHGLRGQGRVLYLPMPILLPAQGGVEPTVSYTRREGAKEVVYELPLADLVWRVGGRNANQPCVEFAYGVGWDHTLDVRINATWGLASPGQVPLRVKQALVGLIRWHSLSFGVDGDDARAQSTMNRTVAESTRDSNVRYHESAIGMGATGDLNVDRLLAQLRVRPGPWIRRGGDLPASSPYRTVVP